VIASCGHQCAETVAVRYHDEVCDAVDGFIPCVVYAEFCPPCAEAARAWPEFIAPEPTDLAQGEGQRPRLAGMAQDEPQALASDSPQKEMD